MSHAVCTECGEPFTFDMLPRRGKICFKCHLGGVRLGFSRGKEEFHGPTIGERQRLQEAQADAAGVSWERLPEKATF